ncbi:hypothetical protein LTR95_018278 [Oleoguttula sp. CCFEE 5521]
MALFSDELPPELRANIFQHYFAYKGMLYSAFPPPSYDDPSSIIALMPPPPSSAVRLTGYASVRTRQYAAAELDTSRAACIESSVLGFPPPAPVFTPRLIEIELLLVDKPTHEEAQEALMHDNTSRGLIVQRREDEEPYVSLLSLDTSTSTMIRHLALLPLIGTAYHDVLAAQHTTMDSETMLTAVMGFRELFPRLQSVSVRIHPAWDGFLDAATTLRTMLSPEPEDLQSVTFTDVGRLKVLGSDGLQRFFENPPLTQTWHGLCKHAPEFLADLMARPDFEAIRQAAKVQASLATYMSPPLEEFLCLSKLDILPASVLAEIWAFMVRCWPEFADCDIDSSEFRTYILQLWDGAHLGLL